MINSHMSRELVEQKMNDELELAIKRSWSKAASSNLRTAPFGHVRRDIGRLLIGMGKRIQGQSIEANQVAPATN